MLGEEPSEKSKKSPEKITDLIEILQYQLELAGDNDVYIIDAFEQFQKRALAAGYDQDTVNEVINIVQENY